MILGEPFFPGESGLDQLVEIIKVLGTPNKEQVLKMNPNSPEEFKFPVIKGQPFSKVKAQSIGPLSHRRFICLDLQES